MISEEQQDQAALYALGLLGADEDSAFESELRANAELRDLVRELREAAGDLALTAPSLLPPASLKSEEHTSELQSRENLVCRLLLEKKKKQITTLLTSKNQRCYLI